MAEWLTNHSRKIVAAWCNAVPHYGNVATSRVEGAHFTLKSLLQTRRNTLDVVTDAVQEIFSRQSQEIAAQLSRDGMNVIPGTASMTVLKKASGSFLSDFTTKDLFSALIRRVTKYALQLLVKQLQLARRPGPQTPCTNYFHNVMGLPCSHDIHDAIEHRRPLALVQVSRQWHVKPANNVLNDPHVVRSRRWQLDSGNSTRADPRHDAPNKRRMVKCSACGQNGHNRTRCPNFDARPGAASQP